MKLSMYKQFLFKTFLIVALLLPFLVFNELVYAQSAVSCWITKIGTPPGEKPALPPECINTGGTTGNGGTPTAGNYWLPLDKQVITSITTEMGSYGGDYTWGGHIEHAGLDIDVANGANPPYPVYAITDGVVLGIYAGDTEITDNTVCADTNGDKEGNAAGCTIQLQHDNDSLTSWYTHTRPSVTKNEKIKKGQQIGVVHVWSADNDHLHLEFRETSTGQNIQPRNYFPDLQIVPVADGYNGDIRAHSASRGIYLLDDGKEFAERFRDHPPCLSDPGGCWAH